jgi:hypothetical protein
MMGKDTMDASSSLPVDRNPRKLSYVLLAAGCTLLAVAFFIGINDNPPGTAAILAGFFSVVLGIVYWFKKQGTRTPGQQLLYWSPRALCIVFAGFISMFALDVFGEHRGLWNTILALLMHLIPTAIILIVLAVSWKWEWVGGVLFSALGVLYLVRFWGRFHWSAYVFISGPLFLVGILFSANWACRRSVK